MLPSNCRFEIRLPLLKLRVSIVFTVGFPSGTVQTIFPFGGAPFPFMIGANFVGPASICQKDIESSLSKPTVQVPGWLAIGRSTEMPSFPSGIFMSKFTEAADFPLLPQVGLGVGALTVIASAV